MTPEDIDYDYSDEDMMYAMNEDYTDVYSQEIAESSMYGNSSLYSSMEEEYSDMEKDFTLEDEYKMM